MRLDDIQYNGLHDLITDLITIKEAKHILELDKTLDGVIGTSMNSYNPLKEDYVASVMSGFFYLHHLNATSNATQWRPANNWRSKLSLFKTETADKIEAYMKEIDND